MGGFNYFADRSTGKCLPQLTELYGFIPAR